MTIEFTTTEIPTKSRSGRTALPNPFIGKFPSDDAALQFVVEAERGSTELNRLVRQARQAAKAVNRSSQIRLTDLGDGLISFKVWTVKRITRGSK